MNTLRGLLETLHSPGGQFSVLLVIFFTGVIFEACGHQIIGAELIGAAVAHLLIQKPSDH